MLIHIEHCYHQPRSVKCVFYKYTVTYDCSGCKRIMIIQYLPLKAPGISQKRQGKESKRQMTRKELENAFRWQWCTHNNITLTETSVASTELFKSLLLIEELMRPSSLQGTTNYYHGSGVPSSVGYPLMSQPGYH